MRKKRIWIFLIIPLIFSMPIVNMIGVTSAQETHDIAIISVDPSPTSVKLGELVNVTVVVKNNGTVDETFNATVYHETVAIETKTNITLAAAEDKSLTFTWNTTDVREEIYATDEKDKTYAINATATIAIDEDPDDNTLVSPSKVKVISHYIAVVPKSTVNPNLTPGTNYTVSIYTDYNGSDVWGYEFTLTYNPLVLQGIEVTNGDLIAKDKHENATFIPGTFNNTLGKLSVTTAFLFFLEPPVPLTFGPGILANITFTVASIGDSEITLGTKAIAPTRLIGINPSTEEEYEIISDSRPGMYHILHGYFRNTAEEVTHDLAVVSVTPSNISVTAGDLLNVTVVVENQGTVGETFDVEVYYDYNPDFPGYRRFGIETNVTLAAGATKTLTFVWDTTGVMPGNRTVTALVSEISGETDTEDNTLQSDQKVEVLELKEQPLPILLIVGVTIVIVAAIAVAYFALRRRKKPTTE